jgi:crotonobetainyl-CoA:carnitine CoA-transferase CaiB-like acyl-CoA transferase
MAATLPLQGIRVLELGAYISGPYAGALLASLGADVVKVEPLGGEPFRRGVGIDSFYFFQYNAGKRSLAVNLKKPAGIGLIKSLLPNFDVFLENGRPGKTAALGLGPEDCHAINPDLIYSAASGFGDGGPLRDRAAYDSIGQSMGGFYSIMNDQGDPRLTGTCLADLITAVTATLGIVASLVGRGRGSGQGMLVQTSLLEAMSTITIDAMTQYFETKTTPTRESRHPQGQNFCLRTASGESVTIHLSSSEKFWQSFVGAMGRPELASDERFLDYNRRMANYFELREIVEPEFMKRSLEEWEHRLVEADVPFASVQTMQSLSEHPQTQWLDLLEPERNGHVLVRPPWRFAGQRPHRESPAPQVGEHSYAVAREVLSEAEVEELIASGVIVQAARQSLRAAEKA